MADGLELIATTAFGLEAVVARELKELGYAEQRVEDGRVRFTADAAAVCRTNIRLRAASRVLLCVAEFEARDFGELFDRTRNLAWEDWIAVDAAFPVRGRSVRSQLHSVPDCQSIVKKAVVERLRDVYRRDWFDETGPAYAIEVSLLNDRATLTLDTSGEALHRRGYRTLVGAAPLRETLAAALVLLSYWNRERPLVDPFCGSGTIPIEAALIGRNIAPGLNRTFAAERWPQFAASHWDAARQEARNMVQPALPIKIIGNDSDERVLSLARQHAVAAGVAEDVHFQQKPLAEFSSARKYGCIITNPPYGERLGEQREVEALYRTMGRVFAPLDTWSIYVLTSHAEFERLYGRRSDRRRKLYNSNIACTYYQFYGPKPPKP
jgi:putative N6-adenine-specific DNA methylase